MTTTDSRSPAEIRLFGNVPDEVLEAVFSPEYVARLNCPLAEHVLRQLAAEYICRPPTAPERFARIDNVAVRNALNGPAFCEHGRSTSGTCAGCEPGEKEEG